MDDLVEQLEEQLERLRDDYHKICRVPVITSLEEETRIVSTSTKVASLLSAWLPLAVCYLSLCALSTQPVIKLLYNRGNNKYSYTS